jgi:hypothetical protein
MVPVASQGNWLATFINGFDGVSSRDRVTQKQTNISSPASAGIKPCNNDN